MTPDETRPDRDALRDAIADAAHGVIIASDGGVLSGPIADAVLAVLEPALTQRDAEIERLQRRIWPSQGEGYANEVERQRAVIEGLRIIARKVKDDLADARRRLAAVEALLTFDPRDPREPPWSVALRAALAGDQP